MKTEVIPTRINYKTRTGERLTTPIGKMLKLNSIDTCFMTDCGTIFINHHRDLLMPHVLEFLGMTKDQMQEKRRHKSVRIGQLL